MTMRILTIVLTAAISGLGLVHGDILATMPYNGACASIDGGPVLSFGDRKVISPIGGGDTTTATKFYPVFRDECFEFCIDQSLVHGVVLTGIQLSQVNDLSKDHYCDCHDQPLSSSDYAINTYCLAVLDDPPLPTIPPTTAVTLSTRSERIADSESAGDPHFRTWKNEHFEFHGQCDIVMTSVQNFAAASAADQQQQQQPTMIDLDIHLRTKMVRYWSYIQAAAIRIGDDILEVTGSGVGVNNNSNSHYWINYEYSGELTDIGGFPVTVSPRNNKYTIDLDSVYPGQRIEIKTFKEFVSVKIIGATEESFGNAVGITGNYQTGKTLGRDGATELDDFNELGLEWQVLPSDGKLFHELARRPQFPELCYLPEDPRGSRARRLAESDITEKAAEKACARLVDEFDRKGCVYDILATQDLDMIGAF